MVGRDSGEKANTERRKAWSDLEILWANRNSRKSRRGSSRTLSLRYGQVDESNTWSTMPRHQMSTALPSTKLVNSNRISGGEYISVPHISLAIRPSSKTNRLIPKSVNFTTVASSFVRIFLRLDVEMNHLIIMAILDSQTNLGEHTKFVFAFTQGLR